MKAIGGSEPSDNVSSWCRGELVQAGFIEVKGWLRPKPLVIDPATVESVRGWNDRIVAMRAAYREREAELDDAVCEDCYAALWLSDYNSASSF